MGVSLLYVDKIQDPDMMIDERLYGIPDFMAFFGFNMELGGLKDERPILSR